MKISNAMVYTTDHKFIKADIYITGERITGIAPCKEKVAEDKKDTEAVVEMDAEYGKAAPGYYANLVLMDRNMRIQKILHRGKWRQV